MTRKSYNELSQFLQNHFRGTYLCNEPLSRHTWYRIGGPVDVLAYPRDIEDAQNILQRCQALNISTYILGEGANLLVSDAGYRGVMFFLSSISKPFRYRMNVCM
jgi:UDP-N-acetylenolpyruvoylglucosamine reductase